MSPELKGCASNAAASIFDASDFHVVPSITVGAPHIFGISTNLYFSDWDTGAVYKTADKV